MAPREKVMAGGVGLQGECDHVVHETLLGQNVDFVRHAFGSGVIHLRLGFAGPFLVLLKPNLEVADGAQVFIEFLSVPGTEASSRVLASPRTIKTLLPFSSCLTCSLISCSVP